MTDRVAKKNTTDNETFNNVMIAFWEIVLAVASKGMGLLRL
jgi:hypothetical protein